MKTLTEFSAANLRAAQKTISDTHASEAAQGKTPEELTALVSEALKCEGDKFKHLSQALEMLKSRGDGLKRVLVMTVGEGEKAPQGAVAVEAFHYLAEYFPQAASASRGRDSYDRDPRGRRDGRRGGRDGDRKGGGRGRDGGERGGRGDRAPRGGDRAQSGDHQPSNGKSVVFAATGAAGFIPGADGGRPSARGPRKPREPRAPRPPREARAPKPPREPKAQEPLSPTLPDGRPRPKITYTNPELVLASIAADQKAIEERVAQMRAEREAKRAQAPAGEGAPGGGGRPGRSRRGGRGRRGKGGAGAGGNAPAAGAGATETAQAAPSGDSTSVESGAGQAKDASQETVVQSS